MFKKIIFVLIAATSLTFGANMLGAAPKFIPGINDLPLMSGLALKSETPMVFDTPGGRIIEVFAVGKISAGQIRAFYGETLPQLGWKPATPSEFQRDKERLKIEISDDNKGGRVVRFSVVPNAQ